MAEFVLVDTDVLVDASRRVGEAIACLRQVERQALPAASTITYMELIVGCRDKAELRKVDRFMARFHLVRLNEQVADTAVDLLRRYRLSHGLLMADALIAASTMTFAAPFVSKNQRDYRFIAGLELLPYPQPFAIA